MSKEPLSVALAKALSDVEMWKNLWNKEENNHIKTEQRFEKFRIESAQTISTLKSEIAANLSNLARQQGYLDRVLEDDGLREGNTRQIERVEVQEIRTRSGPAIYVDRSYLGDSGINSPYDRAQVKPAPKAWFDR